jgi:PAS domain S-box-containing protein
LDHQHHPQIAEQAGDSDLSLVERVNDAFSQYGFMPHGHCYLWKPLLVWVHVISDALIGIAYFAISITLLGLIRKIKIPFNGVVLSFCVFIGACGLTHLMEIWNLWHADYWWSAWIKVITAIASVATGIYLFKLRHGIVQVAEAAKLAEQRRLDLEVLTKELEQRVEERTREVRLEQERFRQMAENMPQIVWTAEPNGQIRYFNSKWYQYTGLDQEASFAGAWAETLHPDDRERTVKAWLAALSSQEPFASEHRMINSAGQYRWHLGRAVPLKDSEGNIIQWFGTATDIEDQKNAEKVLEEAVEARDEFLSIASHELKTPLTSMLLQTQMMAKKTAAEGSLPHEPIRKFISMIDRQTRKLTLLVDDMLDVSRIQAGKLELTRSPIDLSGLIQEVMEKFHHQFEAKGITVSYQLTEPLPISADAFRLDQVLSNLASNAIKYAPNSALLISAYREAEYAHISFKDQGAGISNEKLEMIFERFERDVSYNEVSGLGLGLYISKEIIEAHGGQIWAESTVGEGSTFHVRLPI